MLMIIIMIGLCTINIEYTNNTNNSHNTTNTHTIDADDYHDNRIMYSYNIK